MIWTYSIMYSSSQNDPELIAESFYSIPFRIFWSGMRNAFRLAAWSGGMEWILTNLRVEQTLIQSTSTY